MSGGINAWKGLVAEGERETGLAYFAGASSAEEMISLSWAIEEGNRLFYERLSEEAADPESASLFRSLGLAEERHKEALRDLSARISSKDAPPAPPEGIDTGKYLEDGSTVRETLARVRGKTTREILEIAIALEANALDRYIKMGGSVADDRSRDVFLSLSKEEGSHAGRMAALLDRLQEKK